MERCKSKKCQVGTYLKLKNSRKTSDVSITQDCSSIGKKIILNVVYFSDLFIC